MAPPSRLAARVLRCFAALCALLLGMPAMAADGFNPRHRGVDLADLEPTPLLELAARRLKGRKALGFRGVFSRSVVAMDAETIVVDVVGRHPRFIDHDMDRYRGGVGLVRVRLERSQPFAVEVVTERALPQLELRAELSLADQLLVVRDEAVGFKRSYPVGVGAIDRVRRPGQVSSLTPTTELGRLDKANARKKQDKPAHFRGKPYIPLNVRRSWSRPDGTQAHTWTRTWVGFHIWQSPRFDRGYFSHGCVRLRQADLSELSALVHGVAGTIEVRIQARGFADMAHPYPMNTRKFYELKNYGSVERPRYRTVDGIFVTRPGRGALPETRDMVGVSLDRGVDTM